MRERGGPRDAFDRPWHAPLARLRPSRRSRGERHGSARGPRPRKARSRRPLSGRGLMATRNDEAGGSRLWRGMRHLIFGEDSEPTLREEIEEAIDEAEDSRPVAGDLSPTERQMLRNLLHFGERTAGDIAVTRGDMMAVPSRIEFDALVRAFADAGHSRLPVYGESLDQVVGMIHIKDVFEALVEPARDRSIQALMRNP